MIARFVKIQLVIFTVLSVTAFALVALVYAHVPSLLGAGRIQVTAQFVKAAGLYPNANVTYRGYTVGKVTDVQLAPQGVQAVMSIDDDRLPTNNSRAEIHSVSAIGEQFVDLIPGPGSGPPLADGDNIPTSRTSVPEPVADVLDNAKSLLDSVHPGQLRTVLDEGSKAFRNLGPDLGRILESTSQLVDAANINYAPTERLIHDSGSFLDSQLASSPAIRGWTRSLNGFTQQLKASDRDLRSVLQNGTRAAGQAQDLLSQLSPTTPTLLSSANVLAELTKAYHAPVEQLLVVFPMLMADYQTAVPDDRLGAFNFDLTTNVNPPNCSVGWVQPGQPGGPRNSHELADMPLPANSYCKLPQSDPIQPRSARQLPCFEPGSPPGRRAATIYQCRGEGYRPSGPGQPQIPEPGQLPGSGLQLPGPSELPAPLEVLGAPATPTPRSEDLTWQALLLGPAGNKPR